MGGAAVAMVAAVAVGEAERETVAVTGRAEVAWAGAAAGGGKMNPGVWRDRRRRLGRRWRRRWRK